MSSGDIKKESPRDKNGRSLPLTATPLLTIFAGGDVGVWYGTCEVLLKITAAFYRKLLTIINNYDKVLLCKI